MLNSQCGGLRTSQPPSPGLATMSSTLAKIATIKVEMARTQKNTATVHHLDVLKARLAEVIGEHMTPQAGGAGGAGGRGGHGHGGGPAVGFDMAKTGDTRIGFVDFHLWGSQHCSVTGQESNPMWRL